MEFNFFLLITQFFILITFYTIYLATMIKNKDLWIKLDNLSSAHEGNRKWVRGHTGHIENERADTLANEGIDNLFKK